MILLNQIMLVSELHILPRLKQVSQKPPTPCNHIADSDGDFCTCKQYSHFSVKLKKIQLLLPLNFSFLIHYDFTGSDEPHRDGGLWESLGYWMLIVISSTSTVFFACFCPLVSTDGVKLSAMNTWKPECMTEMRRTDKVLKNAGKEG